MNKNLAIYQKGAIKFPKSPNNILHFGVYQRANTFSKISSVQPTSADPLLTKLLVELMDQYIESDMTDQLTESDVTRLPS